jgi:hypothetical protein
VKIVKSGELEFEADADTSGDEGEKKGTHEEL